MNSLCSIRSVEPPSIPVISQPMHSNRPARCRPNPSIAIFDYKHLLLNSSHDQSQRKSNWQKRTEENHSEFPIPQPQQTQSRNNSIRPEIKQHHVCIAPCNAWLDCTAEQTQHKVPAENLC